MASIKKELKAIVKRFDAAQEAFIEGNAQAEKKTKKSKKKLKSAKAKINSLEQKVASLEQELKVARKKADSAPQINSTADDDTQTKTKTKSKKSKKKSSKISADTPKSTGARRGRPRKSDSPTAEEMATAVSGAPDSVSEAAAEKTLQSGSTDSDATATSAPKPRRGRPAKKDSTTASATKKPRKSRGPGRPSTKSPASPLTQINGVGATMATRFEEAGVNSVEQFANLSDDDMKEVLQKCGPRYRSADHDRMEGYRQAAREAMSSETAEA